MTDFVVLGKHVFAGVGATDAFHFERVELGVQTLHSWPECWFGCTRGLPSTQIRVQGIDIV